MADAPCQVRRLRDGRHSGVPRPSRYVFLLVALVFAAALLASPAGAEPATSPFVLDPQLSLAEQYAYQPSYTRNVPVFDNEGNAYIRSRTSTGASSSYVHTLQGGSWQRRDFSAVLRAAFPTMTGTVGAGGLRSDGIVFDRQDRAYNPLTIKLADGTTRNVLMVSWDHCLSWNAYRLPDGEFAVEHWVGHNEIDGPPFLAIWRPSTVNPAPRSKRFSLWVTKPQLDGDMLVLPPLAHVTDQCLGLSKDSGGSSFAVTVGAATTFVWAAATPAGTTETPQFAATYDHATGTVSTPQLMAAARPANDIHNKPGICSDSQGYLHFVSGAHGGVVIYRRSLAPATIAAGWTVGLPVLTDGLTIPNSGGMQRASQTYDAFVCDAADVLHLVTRQNRSGVDPYFGGATYGALVHQSCPPGGMWGPPTLIVVPTEPGYAVFFHKLALDPSGRLFLSCSSSGGTQRLQAQARGRVLHILGRSAPQAGKYQRRMLLVSDDGGTTWGLAQDSDLVPPPAPTPTPTATPQPAAARAALAPAGWQWMRPPSAGNQLTAISFFHQRTGWAVGTHGAILRTADGGRHWQRQHANTNADLFGVTAANAEVGWIVGQNGLMLHTTNGGLTWYVQSPGTTDTLFAVTARTGSVAWAVGDNGTVLRTRDAGHTWTRQDPSTKEALYAVTFISNGRGWICGGDGRIRMTANGGGHWYLQKGVTHKPLYGITFADEKRGVAVGDDGTTLRTVDGGHTWLASTMATQTDLRAVQMTAAGKVFAAGAGGAFVFSSDRGRTWSRRRLPLRGMCGALAVATPASRPAKTGAKTGDAAATGDKKAAKAKEPIVAVWTGGEGGRPCVSRDAGRSWSPVPVGTSVSVTAAAAAGLGAWLAGSDGQLLRLEAPGAALRTVTLPASIAPAGLAVAAQETWIADRHGVVLHRTGAKAWTRAVASGGELAAIAALGAGQAWVAGADGALLSTADAGHSWTSHAVTSRDLTCLTFTDSLHGWAGGGANDGEDHAFVLRTEDGGQSWQDVESPVWGRVRAVKFSDALNGLAVGEEWVWDGDVRAGVVLGTDDGGLTWTVRARSGSVLNAVLIEGARGYAFGEQGAALQSDDGGLTWAPRDIGTDATLRAAVPLTGGASLVAGDGGVVLTAPAP
jgi:photosystem II stability/assembly factor-like uncharacterized protein